MSEAKDDTSLGTDQPGLIIFKSTLACRPKWAPVFQTTTIEHISYL